MRAIKVSGGVYIDYECTAVQKIQEGVFIPVGYRSNLTDDEFRKDLDAFLEKWFEQSEVSSTPKQI
ncbi:hypothetical protein LJC46_09740 [Desulfovibrio sp. OttesenSCG-928-G15]|nr:hypothetical protein [Desulfovibrio sp. OttesenSCG-928-G15]